MINWPLSVIWKQTGAAATCLLGATYLTAIQKAVQVARQVGQSSFAPEVRLVARILRESASISLEVTALATAATDKAISA